MEKMTFHISWEFHHSQLTFTFTPAVKTLCLCFVRRNVAAATLLVTALSNSLSETRVILDIKLEYNPIRYIL